MSSPAETKIGRFVVRARVGSGAFGTVYRAFDPQLERDVALKVPRKGTLDSPKAAERFLREAKAAARLRHPHIVPVYEAARDASCPYIATAFIEGRTLAQALDAQPLGLRHAVQVAHDLADALAYAHGQGVVHRDVKPANVMLDEKGRALLMDFGLAQQHDEVSKLTGAGAVIGTPSYMSPEQARGSHGPTQPASDQYSLGVVLYELLCGQTPFTGPPGVVLYNVVHTDPPPPRGIQPSVPPDLEAICLKAMAKRPEDRYASMSEFAAALAGYLWSASNTATATVADSDSPARAFAELTIETATVSKTPRRSRGRPAVVGAAAVALLVAAVVAYFVLRPQYGTVRFELSDTRAEVAMRLDGRDLPAAEWAGPMRLPVGRHELEATGKSVEPVKQTFDVIRGENEPVRVEFKPRSPAPPKKTDPRPVVPPKPPEPAQYPPPIDADKMITNTIGMKLAFIPKGKFLMGGGGGKVGEEVEIPYDFYMGIYEVTQGEWKDVLKEPNPSQFSRAGARRAAVSAIADADLERFPVESVTWDDAQRFLVALNAKEKKAGWVYRLPKEAEWEYACRGGPSSNQGDHNFDFYVEEPTNLLTLKQANFEMGGSGLGRTCRVGMYRPNRRGLFDMHGNVWEWCDEAQDSYGKPGHASRGGGYQDGARTASSPHPLWDTYKDQNIGFRVALAPVVANGEAPPVDPPPPPPAVADQPITNSIGMKMAYIPKGKFLMGSPNAERERSDDEAQHEVELTKPFHMAIHEVTQDQYKRVTGIEFQETYNLTTARKGPYQPVADSPVAVDWQNAVDFCRKLSELPEERRAGRRYRLPTEAEWEYACRGRAGDSTKLPSQPFHYGNTLSSNQANFQGHGKPYGDSAVGPFLFGPTKVGSFKSNMFGLYDMHGNVHEWCADYYDKDFYAKGPRVDPLNDQQGAEILRVRRGGSWVDFGKTCRTAYRDRLPPRLPAGIRVVLAPP